jgi:hypothetical protein
MNRLLDRKDPTFIFWYTLSLAWHPTLTTGILPFIALFYMNTQIFIGIRKSRQVIIFEVNKFLRNCGGKSAKSHKMCYSCSCS